MITFAVQKRDSQKKNHQIRREGYIPASIFGGALKESIDIQLEEKNVHKILHGDHEGSRLQLDLEGRLIPAQIKEIQRDGLSGQILHVAFQALKADQKVNSVIHIVLENRDKVLSFLDAQTLEIPYAALPADMIDTITLDMDQIPKGTILTVADIAQLQSDKIELEVPADTIVLRMKEYAGVAEGEEEPDAE